MNSSRIDPKPTNVFYVWYSELCRRKNCKPSPALKPTKSKHSTTVLKFVGDRVKFEEWSPIINALRSDTSLHVIMIKSKMDNYPFLPEIDTEEKARSMKTRYGHLWTAYISSELMKSISILLKNTQVLSFLELNGLPMSLEYLETLLKALKKNQTVKHLSFANCAIKDAGCEMVCEYLRYATNIEVLNLSGCQLTSKSGRYLAKFIKLQQINRYSETWHNSLRYGDPENYSMKGIKRITLNRNSELQDEGVDFILNELEDDLWIKALDLQRCGITEELSPKIIEVVRFNKSLEIVDLRHNDLLELTTVEKVLMLLHGKRDMGSRSEFQWCDTTLSIESTG